MAQRLCSAAHNEFNILFKRRMINCMNPNRDTRRHNRYYFFISCLRLIGKG